MITIDLERRRVVDHLPGGVFLVLSFRHLLNLLRDNGSISDEETVTHMRIDVESGTIDLRVGELRRLATRHPAPTAPEEEPA